MHQIPKKLILGLGLILVALALAGCSLLRGSDDTVPSSTIQDTPVTESTTTVTTVTTVTIAPSTSTSSMEPPGDFETASCGELTGEIICEAYELIQRHYVDPVTAEALVDGAIEGIAGMDLPPGAGIEVCPLPTAEFEAVCQVIDVEMLNPQAATEAAVAGMVFAGLDSNSAYFDPEALAIIEEEQSGEVEGIGALVATQEEGSDEPNSCQVINETCRLRIVSTIEGGPARAADLQADDEFLRVDGASIEGWSVDEVTAAVRGPAGTSVDLTFLRDVDEFTVTIIRAEIQVPVVESEMVGDVAYLRLNLFTDNADEQLRIELGELLANQPSALVFDMRNNPGGLLDTAVNVTSEFIADGLVVSTQSPESTTPYEVEPGGIATDPSLPMYVVVNEGSASASEVVAGALSDAGRAVIVGENTFGKNTVQQRFPLSNGGALKLTIARWFTPAGRDFGGGGITPDVTADLPDDPTAAEVVAAVDPTAA